MGTAKENRETRAAHEAKVKGNKPPKAKPAPKSDEWLKANKGS